MLKNFTILIFVLIAAAAGASAQTVSEKNAGDEAAIRARIEQVAKGWNAKSGAEFARSFAADADYVVVNGRHLKGRPAIDAAHQQIFDTFFKDHDVATTIEQIRFLRPDVAVAHVFAERYPKAERNSAAKGRLTLIFVKNGGGWEIAAFQNTPLSEAGDAKK